MTFEQEPEEVIKGAQGYQDRFLGFEVSHGRSGLGKTRRPAWLEQREPGVGDGA